MRIPDEFIEELRQRNDIESVVSSYVTLKRRGSTSVGLCPFHSKKSPSFTVYPSSNSYYCFGCGAGGDPITFIRGIENLDYIDIMSALQDENYALAGQYCSDGFIHQENIAYDIWAEKLGAK